MASLRNKKDFENWLLFIQIFSFKVYKTYVIAILTPLVLKLYINKNLRCSFKATSDVTNKGKLQYL